MDKEQEQVQVLGFIGTLKESIKIILSHPKLYSKISLTFILPFNFLILANFVIIKLIGEEIVNNSSTSSEDLNLLSSKLIIYYCLGSICIIAVQPLFSFSIAAVIYSTGCIYTGKDITFQKALSVALKVRGRLAIIMVNTKYMITTYVYKFVIMIGILASDFGMIFGFSSTPSDMQFKTWILKIIIVILVVSGEIYMIICMQLANVITVIEDISGSEAMERSKQLMKGNNGRAIAISIVLFLCSTPIYVLAQQLVGIKSSIGLGPKIVYGITSMVLNPLIIIYCWVAPTMLYFVCKTYHGESIDISSFDDCSDASKLNGDYVALEEGEKIDKLEV